MATLYPTGPPAGRPVPGRWALAMGLFAAVGLAAALLTAIDLGGRAALWENAHWTVFYGLGFVLAVYGVRTATKAERPVRVAIALTSALWLFAQFAWLFQSMLGIRIVPSPSDIVTFAAMVPAAVALDLAARWAATSSRSFWSARASSRRSRSPNASSIRSWSPSRSPAIA